MGAFPVVTSNVCFVALVEMGVLSHDDSMFSYTERVLDMLICLQPVPQGLVKCIGTIALPQQ